MKHDPAAVEAYVAGELTGEPHTAFEEHLLACQACWEEVEAGRRGRELVLRLHEPVPEALRQRVLEMGTRRRLPRWTMAVAACLAVLVGLVVVVLRAEEPMPASVAAAISGFRSERLPGARIPSDPAPDLSKIGFAETAAGGGNLADVPVTAYAYRDQLGRRILLYVGERPFATPREAARYGDASSSWLTHYEGLVVLCGRNPHTALLVGRDEQLVRAAADFLDLD